MTKLIYTHNGTFHADEISAIALLKVFKPGKYNIQRVDHQTTEFPHADYIIDTGREYDNKTRFDHHQWEGGLSSAGLIWKHINLKGYTEIDELVQAIDDNDVGVKPAGKHEYSRIISMFNAQDIHSTNQCVQFKKAVDFAVEIFTSLNNRQDELNKSEQTCKDAPFWPNSKSILELPSWQLGWQTFINGETRPDIEAVVWPDLILNTWNIQTTNKSTTSYEKVGRKLMPYDKMKFVHLNNFFAVADSKELMDHYIQNHMEKPNDI